MKHTPLQQDGVSDSLSPTQTSVANKPITSVSHPTAFSYTRMHRWIPHFVYKLVIDDVNTLVLNAEAYTKTELSQQDTSGRLTKPKRGKNALTTPVTLKKRNEAE